MQCDTAETTVRRCTVSSKNLFSVYNFLHLAIILESGLSGRSLCATKHEHEGFVIPRIFGILVIPRVRPYVQQLRRI
jgi:hypothetical protein